MKRIYVVAFAATLICLLAASPAAAQRRNVLNERRYPTYEVYKSLRFAIGGGPAIRLGSMTMTGDKGLDKMTLGAIFGYNVNAEGQYFLKKYWGLGLNANLCSSTATGNNVTFPNVGTIANYKESQYMLFVGPSFAARNEWKKFMLVYSGGVGPLFYFNRIIADGRPIDSNKTSVGINAGVSGEYKLNDKMGVGLKFSYTFGFINSVNVEGKEVKTEELVSLSNALITGFISFRAR